MAAFTSPEPEAEILSKFNPSNHSWRVYLRIGVLSGNTRLATLQALLKAKQIAVSTAAVSLAQQSPASLGLPSSSQESLTPSGRSNSSGHSPFSSSSSSSSGAAGVMGGGASTNLFTPPSTPLRTTAIVATTTSPSSPPSISSSLSAASSPQQQRVAAKISDNDLNTVYRSASNVIRHYQLAGNNGVWLSPLMPIYSRYYNIIHLLALPVHQIVLMVEDPNTKVKPREWSFADTLLKLSNAVQLSKTEVLKVALAAVEHIFDDAKSKKSLPLWEMLPYFVLTKQDLPAAHVKSFMLNAFRQELSLVEHMSIDVISQLAAENQGLISKTDFCLLHPLALAIQKQLVFYYYIPMVVSPPLEVNIEQSKIFLRFCKCKAQNKGIIQELGDIMANGLRCYGSIIEGLWIINSLQNPWWKWLAQSICKGHWDVLHQAALGLDRGNEVLPMDPPQSSPLPPQQLLDATPS
ncbi:hypothetical protein QOT17_017920 [Balamuthia mandrillaris]